MSDETRKVLQMLSEGKITAADAERLLDKLSAPADAAAANSNTANAGAAATASATTKKFLRVLMQRPGGDDVNVRVPLTFVRSGVNLMGVLPPKILEKLRQEGIDPVLLSHKAGESLDELHVDMETKSGKRIRVFCE
jgi:hypothetical protein